MPTPYRLAYSFPGGMHVIAGPEKFRNATEAAKFAAEKLGYPEDWPKILKSFKAGCYVGSNKTDMRIHGGRWTQKDLED
jgi:hypothetical protein